MTDVYVLKRPWVDYFMEEVAKQYEVVVFTASLAKYADPLLDLLDKRKTVRHRLFRESCYLYQGNYVKDLTSLGRPMASTVIVDNSPHSYAFQPQNALPVSSFIDDPRDNDLLDMLPYLQELAGRRRRRRRAGGEPRVRPPPLLLLAGCRCRTKGNTGRRGGRAPGSQAENSMWRW